ncbi:MAG: outer membrane beta-barrel protein [Elusimicrobiota bacterium]
MRRLLLPALWVCLAPGIAFAQIGRVANLPIFDSELRTGGLQLGWASPTGTSGFNEIVGGGVGLRSINFLGYQYLLDWVAVGIEAGITKFKKGSVNDFTTGAGGGGTGTADENHLGILMRVNFLQDRSWTPYMVGGLAYHSFKMSISADPDMTVRDPMTGAVSDSGFSRSVKGVGVSAGAGIEAFVLRGLSVSFESRWRQIRFTEGPAESLGHFLGFHLWFGPKI